MSLQFGMDDENDGTIAVNLLPLVASSSKTRVDSVANGQRWERVSLCIVDAISVFIAEEFCIRKTSHCNGYLYLMYISSTSSESSFTRCQS